MKVILYIDKREGDMIDVPIFPGSNITKRMSYLQAVEEDKINGNKVADAAFIVGEQIPDEYLLSSKYLERVIEIDDAKLAESYASLAKGGYRGTPEKLAKLTAMDIPVVLTVYDVLPTTNLKWDYIRDTLNKYGGVVNNNAITAFQSGANILMFAKYKPSDIGAVNFTRDNPGAFVVDSWDGQLVTIKDKWWIGKNGTCNINIPIIDNLENNSPNDVPWSYIPVPGGQSAPYRLGDFAGYDAKATSDMITLVVPEYVVIGQSLRVPIYMPEKRETELTLNDIYDVAGGVTLVFRIWVQGKTGYYKLVEFQPKHQTMLEISAEDLEFIGMSPKDTVCMHLMAKDVKGRYRNMKATEDTTTLYKVKVFSTKPYDFVTPRGEVLQSNSDIKRLRLYNITFGITAVGFSGGTLGAGSKIAVYRYKSGNVNYKYEQPWYETGPAGELTVAAGEIRYYPIVDSFDFTTNDIDESVTKAVVIWWNSSYIELSRLEVTIRKTDF